jgi:nitrogen fixation protein FixH
LHWQVDGKLARIRSGDAALDISARDTEGVPLAGLIAEARLVHPADERLDHVIALKGTAAGQFHGEAEAPPGQWELIIDLYRSDARVFRSRSRVTLR